LKSIADIQTKIHFIGQN